MKRTRIMGLCVMAALAVVAFSAMAASSASAASYKYCAAMKKGEYTTSTCATKSSKPHKGHFELKTVEACVAQKKGEYTTNTCTTKSSKPHKGHFEKVGGRGYTTATGEAKLETPSLGGTVKCSASKGAGSITGPKTASLQVTFTGCETKGVPCESAATLGSITTLPLESTLIGHGEKGLGGKNEPLAGEVWTDIKGLAANGGVQAIFGCEGVGYLRSTGTLAGVDGGVNKLAFSGTTNFENGIGEQGLETAVSSSPTFPPAETLGPFASTEVTKSSITFEKEVDVAS
jgi:hypothetical protein